MISLRIRLRSTAICFSDTELFSSAGILVLSEVISFTSGCYCPACVTNRVPVTGERCAVSGFGQTTADNNAGRLLKC